MQPPSDFKIQVGVNSVLVPVVVRDAQGRAVGDLTQKDFLLFDQDKPRAISGFTMQRRTAEQAGAPSSEHKSVPYVLSVPPPATVAAVPERFIVFLFDDLHFDPGELLRVKKVATRMLGETLGVSDMAAVVTTSGASSGLTHDPKVLQVAVEKLSAHPLYQSRQPCLPQHRRLSSRSDRQQTQYSGA